jgi:hypothetical protein
MSFLVACAAGARADEASRTMRDCSCSAQLPNTAVTSGESTYERTMLHSVLQEKPLVAEHTIAHTSHDATGYHLDNAVR